MVCSKRLFSLRPKDAMPGLAKGFLGRGRSDPDFFTMKGRGTMEKATLQKDEFYLSAVCSSLRAAIKKYETAIDRNRDLAEITRCRRKVQDLCAVLDELDGGKEHVA